LDLGARRNRGGCGFAAQLAGNVQNREAPTILRECLEIRLDENLDGLFAVINLDTKRCAAKLDLVASIIPPRMMAWGIIVSAYGIGGDPLVLTKG
jgi:hypothetical protein